MSEAVKPPRCCFLDFPLGCPCGKPHEPAQQREILRAAFALAETFALDEPWAMKSLPFQWSADGSRAWEDEVRHLYRTQGIAMVAAHQGEHARIGESLIGREREFAIRCNC